MKIAFVKTTIVSLLTVFFLSQCTKIDTTSVGSGLIPGVDNIHTFDTTFNVIGNNYDGISLCDSTTRNDILALGTIDNNPLFGSTSAEIYFNFTPSAYPVVLPQHDDNTMVVDSVVLVLKYVNSYGDTNLPQKVNVYDLASDLSPDSNYSTCIQRPYFTINQVGSATFIPARLKDSIHVLREDDNKQLRITLDKAYGERFIDNVSALTTDSAFKSLFHGLAVVPDAAQGGEAINYFYLGSASSRISIYTTSKQGDVTDTSIINLSFTSNSGQANYMTRQRGASEVTGHLTPNPNGDSLLFIQTYPMATYAKLTIPSLSGFPNSVINQAELIIEQAYDPAALPFQPPNLLYIDVPDTSGRYIPIPCDFSTSELQSAFATLGGAPKTILNHAGQQVVQYKFNISRYVQSIVTKKDANAELRLRAPFYILNATAYVDRCGQTVTAFSYPTNQALFGGVKISGTNSQASHIRLRVIYSKL